MWARVTKADDLTPDGMKETMQHFQEVSLPALKDEPGFRGAVIMVDREGVSVNVMGMTFWESRKDVRVSRDKERQARESGFSTGRAGREGPPPDIGIFEIELETLGLTDDAS